MTTTPAADGRDPALLVVRDLGFRYANTTADLFTGVSFSIGGAKRLAISGPNGSGKSTLLRLLLDQECFGERRGTIAFGAGVRARDIALVGDFGASEECHGVPYGYSVRTLMQVQNALVSHSCSAGLDAIGDALRIGALMDRLTSELSSGERKKLQLFLALAKAPKLMLADEPFENIDVSRRSILPLVREFLVSHDIAALFITHRREEAESLCEAVLSFGPNGCSPIFMRPATVLVQFSSHYGDLRFQARGTAAMTAQLYDELESRGEPGDVHVHISQ